MRYFLDTEFNGFCGDLISIALVPADADAAPFYEALECASPTPWVAEHVLPVLRTRAISRGEASARLARYLDGDPDPLIVADWPEDVAHLARLMVIGPGRRIAVPHIRFELIHPSDTGTTARSAVPHNAYHDAVAFRAYVLATEAER